MSTDAARIYSGGRWHELKSLRIELRPPAATIIPFLTVRPGDLSVTGTFQQQAPWVSPTIPVVTLQDRFMLSDLGIRW